jgi:hypothetical protein
MAAKGEKVYSPNDNKVQRFKFEPVEVKDWEATLVTKSIKIAKPSDPANPMPYITGLQFKLSGSAAVEGQKDRSVFHRFFLHTQPKKNGGTAAVNMAGGLTEFFKAVGRNPRLGVTTYTSPDGSVEVDGIDAQALLSLLKEMDGTILSLRTKTEPKWNSKTELESVVDYFNEADVPAEDADTSSDEDDDDDSDDEDDEEEEAPAPAPKKKGKK